jgi:hypothetical protein
VNLQQNPFIRFFALIAGGLLLVGALAAGAVIAAVLIGASLMMGVVFAARIWWLRRRMRGAAAPRPEPNFVPPQTRPTDAIDAEFRVIEDDKEEPRR